MLGSTHVQIHFTLPAGAAAQLRGPWQPQQLDAALPRSHAPAQQQHTMLRRLGAGRRSRH